MSWQRETPTLRLVECDIDAPLLAFAKAQYAFRRRREAIVGLDIFAEPAWDMLLDLYIQRGERRAVSVHSLCIAAAVPATTALRWIGKLAELGLIERRRAASDARVVLLSLTDAGLETIERCLRSGVAGGLAAEAAAQGRQG